jgi:transcriptional regulator with XRE-family HTH domain
MEGNLLQVLVNKKLKDGGLSYREAAKEIGISHTTVARVAGGDVAPDIDSMIALCQWLGVSPSHILDAELPGSGSLGAKIAALVEANPELEPVFTEAMNRVEAGRLDPATLQDLLAYASYRLRMTETNVERDQENP